MADHGRSSDSQYPSGEHPPGRGRPTGPPPSVWRTGAQAPVGTGVAPSMRPGQHPSQARPTRRSRLRRRRLSCRPRSWADPAVGRRWTSSWRMRPTGAQPALQTPPRERPAPPPARRVTGAMPRRDNRLPGRHRAPGHGRRSSCRLWGVAGPPSDAVVRATRLLRPGATGAIRATAANPALDPAQDGRRRPDAGPHQNQPAPSAGRPAPCGRPARRGRQVPCGRPSRSRPVTGRARNHPAHRRARRHRARPRRRHLPVVARQPCSCTAPVPLLVDIGEVLGLLAGYGVIILVALMARLPPLERGIGTDRLARWHSIGGRLRHQRDQRARRVHRLGLRGHRAEERDQ